MTEQSPMHEEAPGKEGSMTRCACCFAPSESEFCSVWCREAFVPERVYHLKREEAVSAERQRLDAAIEGARAKRVGRRGLYKPQSNERARRMRMLTAKRRSRRRSEAEESWSFEDDRTE